MRAAVVMGGLTLALVAGCAQPPMTRDRAERQCREEARLADGIAGTVGVGVGSEGGRGRGSLTVTSDILNPRPEAEAFADCVARRLSGDTSRPSRAGLTIAVEGDFD